ncbi:hypothetical protein DFS34DRAFT_591376 [Phlyctochytrium arcticum]|nr:hypothetical protein DFS34DRAFT_591376 [Phlyctochytrium arcticum]
MANLAGFRSAASIRGHRILIRGDKWLAKWPLQPRPQPGSVSLSTLADSPALSSSLFSLLSLPPPSLFSLLPAKSRSYGSVAPFPNLTGIPSLNIKSRFLHINPLQKTLTSMSSFPSTTVPQQFARFENKLVASRPIPSGQFASLGDIQVWAFELIREVRKIPKSAMSTLNIFTASKRKLDWTILANDKAFEDALKEEGVIFYFSFKKTVDEKVSQELLTGLPRKASLYRSFVNALRQKDPSIPEWPEDCDDSKGRGLFKSTLTSVLAKRATIIYDEIQAQPQFTRALMRVIADARTDPTDRMRICSFALVGTPPSVLSPDAMIFATDEFNKIDERITISPFGIKSFIRAIEQAVGYLPAFELLILWTVTGGIARHLQSLLGALASSYAIKENKARTFGSPQYFAIRKWLQQRARTMETELKSAEWQFLRNMTNGQSEGADVVNSPLLDDFLAMGVFAPLYSDLSEYTIASYTVNNSYIRTIARSLSLMKRTPKQLVMDVCGFGLEDFMEKLFAECREDAQSLRAANEDDEDDEDDDEDDNGQKDCDSALKIP